MKKEKKKRRKEEKMKKAEEEKDDHESAALSLNSRNNPENYEEQFSSSRVHVVGGLRCHDSDHYVLFEFRHVIK